MMNKITVLLADDHDIVLEGLRMLLSLEDDMKVISEAKTGREAVKRAKELHPAVVVMDIAMPILNGLEATRQILKVVPATKVLVLSAHSDDAYVDQFIALGASGYINKQSTMQVLAKAIREVHKGKIFLGPSISKRLHDRNRTSLNGKGQIKKQNVLLSAREVEVLQLIAEGAANKQIAAELEISIKTIEKHRQHLMEKLHIHDTAGLTRYAISAGIIENSIQSTIR
jgi:DNA-binding NarL/FixJ family response regulator